MINYTYLIVFILVFLRMSAFIATCPVYAVPNIPVQLKAGFAFILAMIITPLAGGPQLKIPGDLWGYLLAFTSEVGVGLVLGLVTTMVFNTIRTAGQLIDIQIGFGMASLLDPLSGQSSPLITQLLYFITLITFFDVDGHYMLIAALVKSYQVIPLSAAQMSGNVAQVMTRLFADTFMIALQICAPVIAVLFILDIALGLLGRAAPQINVFIMGFPIKILGGLVLMSIMLPTFLNTLQMLFEFMEKNLLYIMRGLA